MAAVRLDGGGIGWVRGSRQEQGITAAPEDEQLTDLGAKLRRGIVRVTASSVTLAKKSLQDRSCSRVSPG